MRINYSVVSSGLGLALYHIPPDYVWPSVCRICHICWSCRGVGFYILLFSWTSTRVCCRTMPQYFILNLLLSCPVTFWHPKWQLHSFFQFKPTHYYKSFEIKNNNLQKPHFKNIWDWCNIFVMIDFNHFQTNIWSICRELVDRSTRTTQQYIHNTTF